MIASRTIGRYSRARGSAVALAAISALAFALAAAPPARAVRAERWGASTERANHAVKDRGAWGRRTFRFSARGALLGVARGPGVLVVRARGLDCAGAPVLRVEVDGRLAIRTAVGPRYGFYTAPLSSRRHRVRVAFANPARRRRGCARALLVDSVRVRIPRRPRPASGRREPVAGAPEGTGPAGEEPVAAPPLTGPPSVIPPVSPPPTPPPAAAAVRHVVWVVFENHGANAIFGPGSHAPNFRALAASYGLASNMHGVVHPSLGNYIALVSGSTQGISDDSGPGSHRLSGPSIFSQVSHRTLAESAPGGCARSDSGPYAVRHNPEVYFTDLPGCATDDVPLTRPPQLDRPFTLIVPDLCHDMHSNSCAGSSDTIKQGDDWLAGLMPEIFASPQWREGSTVVFVTFDEDGNPYTAGNQIGTLVIGPRVAAGTTSATAFTHYSLLGTTEELLGLPLLAGAQGAPSMRAAFGL